MTPEEFYYDIKRAWNKETSACPNEWSESNPSRGQCAVTALLFQDRFGGELIRTIVQGESHYFNKVTGYGTDHYDFTIGQFVNRDHEAAWQIRDREYVLSFPDTKERYELLKHRLGIIWFGTPDEVNTLNGGLYPYEP